MGVPKFYRWISERYACLSETVKDHQIPEFDNLYLDMNGIVHVCSHPDDGNTHFRITEEKIFSDIFHYLEVLFRMIKPRKVFFMAIDGVAPRAKMNQQRGRRFRSAKDAENLEQQAKSRGETLPTEARFDSNCITPGTAFMVRLHQQLQYFVVNKISNDKLWQGVTVYLSGHETPGEGEHKIMDFIRSEKARPDYDSNTRHCLYGLDADLIMLGLTTHEPHFALLREEVRFGKQAQKRSNTVEETTFHLLHISLLREYLDLEFSCIKPNLHTFSYDLERIIDDWVLMGFLVGNDFIPHLPHLHIAQDALPTIWNTYKQMLPSLGGYLNDKGTLDMCKLEQFLEALSEYDKDKFSEGYADQKWMDSKGGGRKAFSRKNVRGAKSVHPVDKESMMYDLEDFQDAEIMDLPDEADMPKPYIPERLPREDSSSFEFRKHKSSYYFEKMDLQAIPEVLAQQAKDYVIGLQWILYYYYTGVPSWGWFFPHHYAPYMSDLHSFSDIEVVLDPGHPFLPFQQLMAVLPSASKALLPEAYHTLMLSEHSPIIEFYPQNFDFDMNGKQQDWEAVVLIPFIEETKLVATMSSVEQGLTAAEKARNIHSSCLIYNYCGESQGIYPSPLTQFPDLAHNHTIKTTKTWKDFVVTQDELRCGLCADVKPALYYPGFPTFTHIQHRSYLQKMGVTVFQQASRNENRIVQLIDDMDIDDIDLTELGESLLGQSLWVNWPHMFEAQICSLQTYDEKVEFGGQDKTEVVKSTNNGGTQAIFMNLIESLTERYEKRRGIDIGPTFVLVHAQPITGRKYLYLKDGRVTVDKEWQPTSVPFALQACVRNDKMLKFGVESSGSVQFFSMVDIFPTGSQVFVLAQSYYGCEAEVLGHPEDRVRLKVTLLSEPDLRPAIEYNRGARYMKAFELSQHLGVSSHFISRITGTMFLQKGNENLNIGLDLKNNKKNEECPGFSRKDGSDWLYSQATEDVIRQYIERLPGFIEYVHENLNKDKMYAENVFPTDKEDKCKELMMLVKSFPTYKCSRAKCGGEFLEQPTVRRIEELTSRSQPKPAKHQTMIIKPSLIYKQYSLTSTMVPDPEADYKLFDRVVNVRMGYTVPFGLRGTVIGIVTGPDPRDTQIEVVFDQEFACGLTTRCSPGRGYRCSPHALINVTYGRRISSLKDSNSSQTNKSVNSAQARNSPQLNASKSGTPRSYSLMVAGADTTPASSSTNNNLSNNSNSPSRTPMTVLKRPDSSKPKSANQRGASLKPIYQVRPVVKNADNGKSAADQGNSRGSPSRWGKTQSPALVKPINGAKSETSGNSRGKTTAQAAPLMKPSEFVTPKTEKLDGRRKSSEKFTDHADIWNKLKVAKGNDSGGPTPLSSILPGKTLPSPASAPTLGSGETANQSPSMSQALAALQNIQITATPPDKRGSKEQKAVTVERLNINGESASASPKAGEKIDISALLGGDDKAKPKSQSASCSKAKGDKKQHANRELYAAGKPKPKSDVTVRTLTKPRKIQRSPASKGSIPEHSVPPVVQPNSSNTRHDPEAKEHAPPSSNTQSSGGFNFASLVSALEKNMCQADTNQELSKLTLEPPPTDCETVEMEDVTRVSAPPTSSQADPAVAAVGAPSEGVGPPPTSSPHVLCGMPLVINNSQLISQQRQQVQQQQQQMLQQQQLHQQQLQHQRLLQQQQLIQPQPGMVTVHPQFIAQVPGALPPTPENVLIQWTAAMNIAPPHYQFVQVGGEVQACVFVEYSRYDGPIQPNQPMAVRAAAQVALSYITSAQAQYQRQQGDSPLRLIGLPPHVNTANLQPGPTQPSAGPNKPLNTNSNFVPLQVTKQQVHEERVRTDSESSANRETDNKTVDPPTAESPILSKQKAGPKEGNRFTATKQKSKAPKKARPSKSRLAANFGPAAAT